MFKLVLEKAEEPEIKLPTSTGSSKKEESYRKTSISALLTMPKPSTVWITINWKILQEMGIPDHLTCLLKNPYAGQEATVRTGHGTIDWFQIGKGVHLQELLELTPKKDVLFIIGDWNAKVGSQETPGVTGIFGLGILNKAGQRLIEFCQKNALVIANTLFQQHKRRFYTWTSPDGQH